MTHPRLPFEPGTVSWDVLRRPIFFVGGMSALLLQVAEPRVARGVAQHSDFTDRIFDRLRHTIELMMEIGLGDPDESEKAIRQMDRAHRRVRGTMDDGVPYDARDPELRLWVLATLIATVLAVEEKYVGEFAETDRARYYQESLLIARALGVEDAPEDLAHFRRYFARQVDRLEVGDEAWAISRHVLHPRLRLVPDPVLAPMRLMTADLLPRSLRDGYGLGLRRGGHRWLWRSQSLSRKVIPSLPHWIRTFPVLRPVGGVRDRLLGSVDASLTYRSG